MLRDWPVFLAAPEDDRDRPATPVPPRRVHADVVGDPAALREVAAVLTAARAEGPFLVEVPVTAGTTPAYLPAGG